MNSIYFEILDHLFNYLDLKTKLKCRLINKHWLFLIDHKLRLKNIVFYNDIYYDKDQFNKLETNQVINNLNLISNKNLNSILNQFNLDKFYYFNSNKIKELGLYYLNCLNIEKLLTKFNKIIKLNVGFILNLNQFKNQSLNLECLNLENLSFILQSNDKLQLIIKYPYSIKYLNLNFNFNLKELINLQILQFNSQYLSDYNKNLLIFHFKKLKEIHLNNFLLSKYFHQNRLDKKLKIFFIGINFDRVDQILETKFCNLYQLFLNNRLEEDKILFNNITYDRLESLDFIDNKFIRKFIFNQITFNENIVDENRFLNFIYNCNYFKSLLIYPIIKANLIKKLTKVCPFIVDLSLGNLNRINSDYKDNELKEIIKFKYLKSLSLPQTLSIDLIELFFDQLKHLKSMETRENYNSYHQCIKILDVNYFIYTIYKIRSTNEDVWHFKNFQSLIKFIQSKESITFKLKYNNLKSQFEYYSY